ncbi:MAG: S-layer homology domain-containing protein [Clostridia bacterium]|nr:S-layer homology domain-containing protein [Clostridia bacterium]
MNRKISLFISVMLMLNLFAGLIPAASAENVISSGFEFIDTAYNPDAGVYLAAAKSFSQGGGTQLQIYRSEDGISWEKVKTFSDSAKNYASEKTRQILVWWEDAGVFATVAGAALYVSSDGIEWTRKAGLERGNAEIETDGRVLLVSGGKAAKIISPDEIDTTAQHYLFDASDSVYSHAVGIFPGEEQKFIAINTWSKWLFDGEGGDSEYFAGIKKIYYDHKGTPYEMVYEPVSDVLLTVNGTAAIWSINREGAVLASTPVDGMLVTAAGAGHGIIIAGGSLGELCFTDAAQELGSGIEWIPAIAGSGDMNEEVRSITPIEDNRFMIVTKSHIYRAELTDNVLTYYDVEFADIFMAAGETRIEVPANEAVSFEYMFEARDFSGNPSEDSVAYVEPGAAYTGVDFDGSILTVAPTADGGDIILRAVTFGGTEKEFTITLVKEEAVVIDGNDSIAIPASGSMHFSYSTRIIGTDGGEMSGRSAALTAAILCDGVTFDETTGELTVDSSAQAGFVTIRAVSDAYDSIFAEKIIEIKEREPAHVRFTSGESSITTDGSMKKYAYEAVVTDQNGDILPQCSVNWSVSGAENSASMDDQGRLMLYGITSDTAVTIRAEYSLNPEIFAEKSVNISYNGSLLDYDNVIPSSSRYEFIDTEYSEELGVYIAVAKTLSEPTHSAEIYKSTDGFNWKKVFATPNGMNSSNKSTRQVVVWWEAAHVFAAALDNKIYVSSDGEAWTVNSNLSVGSNLNVSTNGDILVIGSGASKFVSVAENLTDTPARHTFSNESYTAVAASVSDGDSPVIIANGQYVTWSWDDIDKVGRYFQNIEANPLDMQYSPALKQWLVVNNQPRLRLYTHPGSYSALNLVLDDGSTNTSNLTAVYADKDINISGTANGDIFMLENLGSSSITGSSKWIRALPGNGTAAIDAEMRAISRVGADKYFAVSTHKLYIIEREAGGWRYYEARPDSVEVPAEQRRIEIPYEGFTDIIYNPKAVNCKGEPSEHEIIGFYPITALPDGVSFDFGGDYDGIARLRVNSMVDKSSTLVMRVLFDNRIYNDIELDFVKESSVCISSLDKIPLPTGEREEWEVNSQVLGEDGQTMQRNSVIRLVSAPEGVTFDNAAGKLVVEAGTLPGIVELSAYSENYPDIAVTKKISLDYIYADSIEISEYEKEIIISKPGTVGYAMKAMIYDQAKRYLDGYKAQWSVDPVDGVTVSQEDGTLYVSDEVCNAEMNKDNGYSKEVFVTASVNDEKIFVTVPVTLKMSDYMHALKDSEKLAFDFTALEKNAVLPTAGDFDSAIVWRSTDESVIAADGTVTRNAKQDRTAQLTAVVSYNGEAVRKTFDVKVLKDDNIFANGDVETGDTTGFSSDSTIEAVNENAHGGEYALSVAGSSVSIAGNPLEKNSAYIYEAYVLADAGLSAKMSSKVFGELGSADMTGQYEKILGLGVSDKASTDVFTVSVDGAGKFLLDDVRYFDITDEYDAVTRAVADAEYKKTTAAYQAALKLVDSFYDVPLKEELKNRLSKININDNPARPQTGGSGGGGGGGGGSSASYVPTVNLPNSQAENEDKVLYSKLKFKDMKDHWAMNEVEYMAEKGIISGRSGETFDPDAPVTRAEFASLIVKTMGLADTAYENTFFDVITEDWYSGYVQAAKNAGYVTGSGGLFRPNDKITREEIAKIVVSAYSVKTKTEITKGGALYYSDLEEISSWAYDYIVNAVNFGFVNGVSEYAFAPKASATRAQAAVILKRLLDKLPQ